MYTRIAPPMFKVVSPDGETHHLNEYEMRQLQVDVAKRVVPKPLSIEDAEGNICRITSCGQLLDKLVGYHIATELIMELFKASVRAQEDREAQEAQE